MKFSSMVLGAIFLSIPFSQSSFAISNNDQCGDVLKGGYKATSLYSTRFDYRRLLDTRISNMTFQEAKSDTSLTGSMPIGDVILGAGFTEDTFNSYKSHLQHETTSKVDISRSLDILLSTGDKEILQAWTKCMDGKTGLYMFFSDIQPNSAILNVEWRAAAGVARVKFKRDYALPEHVKVTSGKDILKGKELLVAGTPAKIQFKLTDVSKPLSISFNVEKEEGGLAGSDSAYLPSRLEAYKEERPYNFETGTCGKSASLAVDTRHYTGNSATAKYCSNISDGWKFSKNSVSVQAKVGIPGQIPGTFANYQIFWVGDSQLIVQLGCSNSSSTDIQCHGLTTLSEERWRWKPMESYENVLTQRKN